MDPLNYYTTTFAEAFKTLGPLFGFLIGGYFIFIKLPFLFLKKSMDDQKKKLEAEDGKKKPEEKYTVEDYLEFQKRLRLMNSTKEAQDKESPRQKREQKREERTERRSERRSEQRSEEKKQSHEREEKREERRGPGPSPKSKTPEEVFDLKPGETLSQAELKKRYFSLLKENHPDRVASMGSDFKTLAEKNTKEINKAYEVLKRKAS